MSKNNRNNVRAANKFLSRLGADRKKSIFALSLVAVMLIMWMRVFANKGPKTSQAAQSQVQAESQTKPAPRKIAFIELPIIPGRNDQIARDFFNPHAWKNFGKYKEGQNSDNSRELSLISTGEGGDAVARLAEKLRLQAIVRSRRPQAFINDRLLSVGDTLTVASGAETHRLEVIGILDNAVLLKYGETHITLKLTHKSEVPD